MEIASTRSEYQIAPLVRDTLQERIYSEVADLIMDGAIAPGQQVTIQSLATAFGVSAMPVREALKRLMAANALTVVSGRSMGIPPLSLERLTDLRNVRLEIEGTATSWAARLIDDKTITQLDKSLDRMDQAIISGDTKAYLQNNRAFHFAVYRSANSATLMGLIEIVWLQISPYFNLLRESGNYVSANVHHRAMVTALRRSDDTAAKAAITADIADSYDVLATILA
jgi:DNA-binding GntR family transcriptional regulator